MNCGVFRFVSIFVLLALAPSAAVAQDYNARGLITLGFSSLDTIGDDNDTVVDGNHYSQGAASVTFELFGTITSGPNLNTLLRLDPATGNQTLAGSVGLAMNVRDLAWNQQTWTLFGTDMFSTSPGVIYEIDPETGVGEPVAAIAQDGTPLAIGGLAFSSDGTLWGTTGLTLGVIDLNTESFSPRLALPVGSFVAAIDIAPNGLMYAVLQQYSPSFQLLLLAIDLSIPSILDNQALNSTYAVDDITFAPDGYIYHTNFSYALFRIDPVTLAVNMIGFGDKGALGGIASVPADSDGDGVLNVHDLCPGTPSGAVVDANGCTSQQRIDQVDERVDDLLADGTLAVDQAAGLKDKLGTAFASIAAGRTTSACGQLNAFVNQVDALVNSGALSQLLGDELKDAVSEIRVQIGCRHSV